METILLSASNPHPTKTIEPNVTAAGFFDGVHKGHQKVILTAKAKADQEGLKSAVMTFDPHPSVVLKKEKRHARYITPMRDKQKLLYEMGIDYLFIVHFDQALASMSPQEFVDDFFVKLAVRHVVAGFDFSYGHKGKGSMESLPEHARGRFTQTTVHKVEDQLEKISSTRIRELLDKGEAVEVNRLLGRPFKLSGDAVKAVNGSVSGCPAAGIQINPDYYLPKPGVYAVTVEYNHEHYEGIAEVGRKPADEQHSETEVEVVLFDISEDLHGKHLDVYFHYYVRENRQFSSAEELKRQLQKDEKKVRDFFHKA
ncbi:riboflavin biosynthesis protein RibF [Halobacillus salinarum]|uniref:Riboflavin biosynthesis protein n=1 Tax=Halobacillus salinarum TaxID=2932257 RepID=A0ABY4EEX1_9BACI|nr:riboflavin biosynthesis protein RibF [Halobacillus salinarum]UOQ43013.1 riboflavin biosynthesis protein RibF [Halobacillus salinarum]